MKCPICKATMITDEQDYIVDLDGEALTLESVPIWACEQCDHIHVEPEVIEAIEDMLEHLDTIQSDTDTTSA